MTAGAILICAVLSFHDGDSGRCDGVRFRLAGMDAGEVTNTRCRQRPNVWACSPVALAHAQEARNAARTLASRGGECRDTGERSFRRVVAVCRAGGQDIGSALVRQGLAISARDFGDPYRLQEIEARIMRRGIWR